MNPVHLWQAARLRFTEYLMVFLIVGMGLFNLILLIAPFTLFLLLPPMLVYAGLVAAHYAGQLGGGVENGSGRGCSLKIFASCVSVILFREQIQHICAIIHLTRSPTRPTIYLLVDLIPYTYTPSIRRLPHV
jgi:hypothetical protein